MRALYNLTRAAIFFTLNLRFALCLAWKPFLKNPFATSPRLKDMQKALMEDGIPTWDELKELSISTAVGSKLFDEDSKRSEGTGFPHVNSKLRLFGTSEEPRVTFFRDTAGWCPYCQKVWILLEEKKIPYKIEKINMRSYGDKPAEFLRMVPNGLLPAIIMDGVVQTDSLPIMINLDRTFSGSDHKPMLPPSGSKELKRAETLLQLERQLFSSWCSLVFRPAAGSAARSRFERDLSDVDRELGVTSSPWFLEEFSLVDLTYITHVERMCASVAYWSGFKIRGEGRWPNIEKWLDSFEQMPSYMATKSDYYTHCMDIPPQYGPGYRVAGSEAAAMAAIIDGTDGSWRLPLPPFTPEDVEPVSAAIDPGEEAARHEAAFRLLQNLPAVVKFALRGCGSPGAKRFQAELADPYAVPNLDYEADMSVVLRLVVQALLVGYEEAPTLQASSGALDSSTKESLIASLAYLQKRVGVPRDMSYPAARQLRAHLTWAMEQLK